MLLFHCTAHFILIYRISGELGVGEFGVVRRGVWSVGGEEREVAVKSLADGSSEEKRIQFLQEAAIMSQFKHPSIITLHGVIMDQDLVYIILCYSPCSWLVRLVHYETSSIIVSSECTH